MMRPLLLLVLFAAGARADSGVLIPRGKDAPDAAVLSLGTMRVDVVIDNGDAHVSIVQIFENHSDAIEEGTYRFALPGGATVSDFAVWDGPVRIPAVILERKRAEQVYDQARLQAIDPGLLAAGERDGQDPRASAVFTAKIVPIPAHGTKRLELEYHQRITTTDFQQAFVLPLKPGAAQSQAAAHFSLHLVLHSAHPVQGFTSTSSVLPLKLSVQDAHTIEGSFSAENLSFTDDFQSSWKLAPATADTLEIITHRNPATPLPDAGAALDGDASGGPRLPEPGFFAAQLLLANPPAPVPATSAARTLVLLFDNSLSMQWEKLERSYAALEASLRSLRPGDQFNLLLFNQSVSAFKPQPIPADPAAVQQALEFVRAARLRGGTDLGKALAAGLAQSNAADTSLVIFTDGGSDRGETVLPGKLAAQYAARWKQSAHPPHTCVFAVGDDANLPLLRALARQGGYLEAVLSTEPVDLHLKTFVSRLTLRPLAGLALEPSPAAATRLIYPLDDVVYPGSMAEWVGQYTAGKASGSKLQLNVRGTREGGPFEAKASTLLPATDLTHPQLPRLWAQARVNALLQQIDRDGETAAAIDEIIRLSRRYKFVTPYTSFLAVPRSLLRPRVIRPGDPVLRVRTDPAIASVIALFPFGLTKPLRHLGSEDFGAATHGQAESRLWETRFLAPPEMKDGTYAVRLILRDVHGNTYDEAKTFVIASTPPTVRLQLGRRSVHRGETIEVRASASASTRTLTARLEGLAPIALRWNAHAAASTGMLSIPAALPVGRYTLTVTAEDVAHNLGTQEVHVDVLP